MSIPMQLLLVVAAFCLCLSEGAPDGRIARAKQQRPTRGFKNLEMMTARGFGKRGRPSPRTERDVQHQSASEHAYRTAPTFKSPTVNFGGGFGKRMPEIEPEGDSEDDAPSERSSRSLPTFRSSSMNFGGGYGKRRQEDPEGNVEDQSLLERINRAPPTFVPPKVIFGRGVGKRIEEELEGNLEDSSVQERSNRGVPTFQPSRVIFGRGPGKRVQELDTGGNSEDPLLPERENRALPTFHSSKVIFGRGPGKRRPETESGGILENPALQERENRAVPTFHSSKVIFGRGPGKRMQELESEATHARFNPKSSMMVATDFGKRSVDENAEEVYGLDNFWEMLPGSPEREGQDIEEDKIESIPMDWFVNEIVNNPDFARSVVRKFIDINQDGMLTSDELLRNV